MRWSGDREARLRWFGAAAAVSALLMVVVLVAGVWLVHVIASE